jgi:hypothetical protein
VSRERRDMTHYSSTPYANLVHPDMNLIGMDTPYEKHLAPKWRHQNATIDAKPEKPYINRRSHYH